MPHSLRVKIKGLRYKGILEDKDYKRLCKALDVADAVEDIKAEINEAYQQSVTSNLYYAEGLERAFEIIDKHTKGDADENRN